MYAQQLIAGSGQERIGIRIELGGIGIVSGQLLVGMGGSRTGKLGPCSTLVTTLGKLFTPMCLCYQAA